MHALTRRCTNLFTLRYDDYRVHKVLGTCFLFLQAFVVSLFSILAILFPRFFFSCCENVVFNIGTVVLILLKKRLPTIVELPRGIRK